VPLEQTFIGVSEHNMQRRLNLMNEIAFEKAVRALERGKQVMVFVHSRKDTGKTARAIQELAGKRGKTHLFSPYTTGSGKSGDPDVKAEESKRSESGKAPNPAATGKIRSEYAYLVTGVKRSRNKELRELFPHGLGVHHAGMIRSDRNLTEKMFAAGAVKLLCCTATLAWGVNLPANTVIIKGTNIYDAEAGGFKDVRYVVCFAGRGLEWDPCGVGSFTRVRHRMGGVCVVAQYAGCDADLWSCWAASV